MVSRCALMLVVRRCLEEEEEEEEKQNKKQKEEKTETFEGKHLDGGAGEDWLQEVKGLSSPTWVVDSRWTGVPLGSQTPSSFIRHPDWHHLAHIYGCWTATDTQTRSEHFTVLTFIDFGFRFL